MNKELIEKLKKLRELWIVKCDYISDSDIMETEEFKKEFASCPASDLVLIKPEARLFEPLDPRYGYCFICERDMHDRCLDIRESHPKKSWEGRDFSSNHTEFLDAKKELDGGNGRYVLVEDGIIARRDEKISDEDPKEEKDFGKRAKKCQADLKYWLKWGEHGEFYFDVKKILLFPFKLTDDGLSGEIITLEELFEATNIPKYLKRFLKTSKFKEKYSTEALNLLETFLRRTYPEWRGYPVFLDKKNGKELSKLFGWFKFHSMVGKDPATGEKYVKPMPKSERYLTNPSRSKDKEPRHLEPDSPFGRYLEDKARWNRVTGEYETKLKEYRENRDAWAYDEVTKAEIKAAQRPIIEKIRGEMIARNAEAFNDYVKTIDGLYPESEYGNLYRVIDILEDGRADDVGSALRYMDQLKAEERRLDAIREQTQANGPREYSVYVDYYSNSLHRETSYIVDVEANSEAEAINAAMNMTPGAIRAYVR